MENKEQIKLSEEIIAILENAIEQWGIEKQVDMAIEEMAELIVAINHFKRSRIDRRPVIEEIADVMIAMSQMMLIFGKDKVKYMIAYKLNRLKERLA
jgi:NTP pyrophosphatase (non-canonical NTP hydrolase)